MTFSSLKSKILTFADTLCNTQHKTKAGRVIKTSSEEQKANTNRGHWLTSYGQKPEGRKNRRKRSADSRSSPESMCQQCKAKACGMIETRIEEQQSNDKHQGKREIMVCYKTAANNHSTTKIGTSGGEQQTNNEHGRSERNYG